MRSWHPLRTLVLAQRYVLIVYYLRDSYPQGGFAEPVIVEYDDRPLVLRAGEDQAEYKCMGISIHTGGDNGSGHLTTAVRTDTGEVELVCTCFNNMLIRLDRSTITSPGRSTALPMPFG